EPVSNSYIESIRLTPDVANKRLSIKIIKNNNANVTAITSSQNKEIARINGKSNEAFFVNITNPHLWSPDDPFLYDLKIQLKDESGKITDEVRSYFVMRSIALGDVNGIKRPLLNGKFVL